MLSDNCAPRYRAAAGIYNLLSHGSEWGLPADVASTLEECRADLTSLQLLLLLLEQGAITEVCWGALGRAR